MQARLQRPSQRMSGARTASKTQRQRTHRTSAQRDGRRPFVANCEPSLSPVEQNDDAGGPIPKEDNPDPKTPLPVVETAPSSSGLEDAISTAWVPAALFALTIAAIVLSYNWIISLTERQLTLLSLAPCLWSWGQRLTDLRKDRRTRRVTLFAVRLAVIYAILTRGPFQTNIFIFQHQSGIPSICALCTGLTLMLQGFLQPKHQPPELRRPDLTYLAPFFTDDVTAFTRWERRLSLSWMYLTGVLALPFCQEILYRGILVVSFSYFFSPHVAACAGALAYCMSQPFSSLRQFLGVLFSNIVWGYLVVLADKNLMFPFVAHLLHNAFLFWSSHRQSLRECF